MKTPESDRRRNYTCLPMELRVLGIGRLVAAVNFAMMLESHHGAILESRGCFEGIFQAGEGGLIVLTKGFELSSAEFGDFFEGVTKIVMQPEIVCAFFCLNHATSLMRGSQSMGRFLKVFCAYDPRQDKQRKYTGDETMVI